MKLRTALTQYPFNTLCQLARDVGIDPGGSNKTILADALCRILPDPENVAKRLSSLSQEQRAMVQTLAAEGGELLEAEAVEKFANGFLPRLHAQLRDLTGLVFRDVHTLGDSDVLIGIPESLLKSIPIPDADQGRLLVILKPVSVGLLRAFADQIGLRPSDTRKPIVSNAIRDTLLDIKTLHAYLNTLSEDRRAILDLFLPANAITRSEVADKLGESAVRELEDMLWKMPIFYAPNRDLHAPNAAIYLASDLCATLSKIAQSQGGQLENSLETLLETSIAPAAIRENTAFLIQDLTTLLGIVTQRLPRRLKHGGISKTDLRDANKYCHIQDDPGYIEFLTLFAETTGLIKPHDTVWHTASDAGTQMGQIIDIRKACFDFWFHSERWNEWASDRTKATSARMQVLKNIRSEIVRSLRHCPTDTWMKYPSYYQFLTRLSEPFRHFAKDPSHTGTTADELLRRTITGALTYMGVVRVGNFPNFSTPLQQSKGAVFQITPAGYALLHDTHDDALTEQISLQNSDAKFVVQPNFEVLSPPDLPCAHYLRLCVLGDLKTQDVMACFHLSSDSIRRAFARGLSGDEIRSFLTQHSASGLPDMVDTLIAECDDKYGEIEILPAIGRVKTATRELLDELYAQPRIAQALDDRISPTIATLNNTANPESLIQILQQQGYLPHLSQK
ncbi:MAG: hypothetical protein F4Z86_04145 [Gemmatimonadetes bacterium]|nr:hypothetical protein [Gemmatimonadota bacterium]MYB56175.1 hypothetical protein [Gemmatimonadota bacterium]